MKLRANAFIGALLVGSVALMAFVSVVWTPSDPLKIAPRMRLQPPGGDFLLGSDEFGRASGRAPAQACWWPPRPC
jgi:peptide/nickel transport system permease protein